MFLSIVGEVREGVEYLVTKEYITREWNCIPTNNPKYLSVLEQEKKRANLKDVAITLLVPENLWDAGMENYHGNSSGSKREGYTIAINPVVKDILPFNLRHTIKHELAHIKYGDCDRKLPTVIHSLYSFFVQEPRAEFYALFK